MTQDERCVIESHARQLVEKLKAGRQLRVDELEWLRDFEENYWRTGHVSTGERIGRLVSWAALGALSIAGWYVVLRLIAEAM